MPNQPYACTPCSLLVEHPVEEHFLFEGSLLYVAAWELWLPDILTKLYGRSRPPCPCCGSADRVGLNGWAKFPRRVLDVSKYHFVLARQYQCRECPGDLLMQLGCMQSSCRVVDNLLTVAVAMQCCSAVSFP